MKLDLKHQLKQLVDHGNHSYLLGALRGIEKEGLRVDGKGKLAQTGHPTGLGSALTNSNITTDYSESLLELITPVFKSSDAALLFLSDLHHFTYQHLSEELLWAGSMPCDLSGSGSIPIAEFGSSHEGQLKHVYRVGLEHRYGKMMQTIAGIHYNFSLPDEFWGAFQQQQKNSETLQAFRSSCYFKMIRNFRRNSWILLYLFGASPALSHSFLDGRKHNLQPLYEQTLYLPYATSLRMSDLGYSNKVQSSLDICFNHLDSYLDSLSLAVHTSSPLYERIGVKIDGTYRQLNSNILQIENEYYSDIRPKRVVREGEKPLHALREKGVEYIEVRSTDINPFLPLGIDNLQAQFFDTFLISCLLMNDDDVCPSCPDECKMVNDNLQKVITRGREPGLLLETPQGQASLVEVGKSLLFQLQMTGRMLDQVHDNDAYSSSVTCQIEKLDDVSRTPSAMVLTALQETGLEYTDWVLLKSNEHKDSFTRCSANKSRLTELAENAMESHQEQRYLEAQNTGTFDQFLEDYLAT